MIEGKQQQIESRKRKYGQGSIILELSRSPVLSRTREDRLITMEAIPIMEGVCITIVSLRMGMGMGMEGATDITVPTQQHPPGRI